MGDDVACNHFKASVDSLKTHMFGAIRVDNQIEWFECVILIDLHSVFLLLNSLLSALFRSDPLFGLKHRDGLWATSELRLWLIRIVACQD